jgi:hypothetical protein
VLGTEKIEIAK